MSCGCNCGCGQTVTLLYACSGAANTGNLADQAARKLASVGFGSMTCLAAVGADLSGFIASAEAADKNIVIDGCPVACGAKIFTEKGLKFDHFITTDFGVKKGSTPITPELIADVAIGISQKV
ncbi:MAG: putative zinc-binding protein [Spirochaetia bacterium]|nr:putative zinc-binding protein [Spirochaetia bacterium]